MTSRETITPEQKIASKPKVAVIVLTWNGKALTLDCLNSLSAMNYGDMDIVLVDNHSTDGTPEAVRALYGDRVTVIENERNLGFSGGNNVGIRHALDSGAGCVLLLNNDTVVDPALVDNLVAVMMQAQDIGVVGPKIYYASPADRIWFAGGRVFLSRGTAKHIGIREAERGQHETVRDVDYITGCALMARRQVFETVGFFDEDYEMYFEDADFCMRAKRGGFRIVYAPAGKVWHKISASTGGQLSVGKISRRLRSGIRFFRRYAAARHWLTIPVFFAGDVLRIAFLVAAGRIRNTKGADNAVTKSGSVI